ncbi:DUF5776 domain-containing protein [Levilactobacillus zymae]|uniref:DUF5776 domain-containing protein n=1 Tax=Levilactobacillus zymae TaxID=267363 RepID=UPI0028B9B3CE|nr:DUF5776 domain-containing protein [Levilactobacillus zymae]MDT6980882.1 DUF5776 domain-containing protein [Levilactobacillus zymae]
MHWQALKRALLVGLGFGIGLLGSLGGRAAPTYTLSEVESPYILMVENGQERKQFYHQAFPEIVTKAQYQDDQFWIDLQAQQPEEVDVDNMRQSLEPYLTDPLEIPTGQTLYSFVYQLGVAQGDELPTSEEDMRQALPLDAYNVAWCVSRVAQYQAGTRTFAEIAADYQETLRPSLEEIVQYVALEGVSPELFLAMYDYMFSTEQAFNSLYVTQFYDLYVATYRFDTLSLKQRGELNPTATKKQWEQKMDQPMTTMLKPLGDGTYRLDGLALTIMAFALGEDVDPVPPVNELGQPITVRYQTETGETLAADQTLVGPVGASYQTTPKAFTGYWLSRTAGPATGRFTAQPQTVTYVYTPVTTGGSGDQGVAAKGEVILATKKIGLYRQATFTAKARQQWYQAKARVHQPMFVVTGYARSTQGRLRYQVKDVNHRSRTAGKRGYVTAKTGYVTPTYYHRLAKSITVINPAGINAYRHRNLTGKTAHYRQGQILRVRRVERHNLTTRFVLTNGRYVTANKKLVTSGRVSRPTRVQARGAVNRYADVNLTRRVQHYPAAARARFTVRGYDYSDPHDFTRGSRLRYRVAGSYVTANRQVVRPVK